MTLTSQRRTIAVLGGSGALGRGIALRLALAGHHVAIGSRTRMTAEQAASEIGARIDGSILGLDNASAASFGEVVFLTVPFAHQADTCLALRTELAGRILIDTTVPISVGKAARVHLPVGGSAVAALQAELGPEVRVVSAFQNVSAAHLADPSHDVDCDVLICGDDPAAREIVVSLAADMGLRGIQAGPIANSAAAEALTSVLISINIRYKAHGAGIRITGLPLPGDGFVASA